MRTKRMIPRWGNLKHLLRLRRVPGSRTERLLARAITIDDLRRLAANRTPRSVFDYVDGAAEDESGIRRIRATFEGIEFRPSALRDVSGPDLGVEVLGARSALPFGFAPTGFTRMMHHTGEFAVSRVATERGIPYALSTMGTRTIEEVAEAAPGGRRWFQLYIWKDRGLSAELMERARAAGYEALMVTVDSPVVGLRRRDVRNGFAMPPALTPRTILNGSRYPRWWLNLLTTEPLSFATVQSWDRPLAELGNMLFDPSVTLDDLAWVREHWAGPVIVKGVQTVADAVRFADAGVDAIVLSSHGGRQLDRAPVPLRVLPEAREALGPGRQLWIDSGIMSGGDIVAALASGADFVLVGRAYLYGLMAGGEAGVDRAVDILAAEVQRHMQLLGVRRIADLTPGHVAIP
jgi:L-lactate dehydrogenase (cytochrome)